MFNLKNAKVGEEKKKVEGTIKPKIKKEYRYVITRSLGVANRIIFTVYDKKEMRYTDSYQGKIRNGHKLTKRVKQLYRSHKFIDKLKEEDELLFEF